MMIVRILGVAWFIFLFSFSVDAQYYYRGTIVDTNTNDPLIGSVVLIKDTKIGVAADKDGNFMLEYSQPNAILVFSYIGYEDLERKASSGEILEVKMEVAKEPNYQTLLPNPTVYATRIEHMTPAPVFLVTRNMIEVNSELSPAPVLNQTPGVLMHTGAYNTNRITLRGIGNRSQFGTSKIRAYLDDIPLTTGVGETTIEDLDLSLFDAIRVWKGPAAVTNGVGLGGLIELKTHNRQMRTSPSEISAGIQVGSYGLVRNVNQVSYKKGKFNIGANTSITKSDGYRENNQYDRKSYSLLASYGYDQKNRTTFFGNFTSLKAFIPSSLNRDDYNNNPSAAAFNWNSVKGFEDYDKFLMGISHSHLLWKNTKLRLFNSSSLFTSNYDSYESRPFNILQENTVAFGGRTKFELRQSAAGVSQKYTAGVELFQDNYDWTTSVTNEGVLGDLLSDNEEKRNYYNLFAKYEVNNQFFRLSTGLNLNNTKYALTDLFNPDSTSVSGDYAFENILSPQIGLLFKIRRKFVVYLNVSHGFSPPSLEETLTPDGQINTDIRPEQGWNFEIGSRFKNRDKWNYEIALFSMQINDLLVAERIAEDQYVGVNAGKTIHNGVEFFTNYLWINRTKHRLLTDLTYTYSDFKFDEYVDEDNDYSGNKLTGTPDHTLHFAMQYMYNKSCYVNLNYRFVDKMPMRDDNSIYSESFNVVNTKVGYKKFFGKFGVDFHVGVNNLFDEKYASMVLINAGSFGGNAPRYYYPGMPTNFYGGIELAVKF